MLYAFAGFWVRLAFRGYFRRIYYSGRQYIPYGKPLILACNHPNSFLDALVIAAFIRRPVYFLARGDVFKGKRTTWLLSLLHVIPVFRLQEGPENLHKNEHTFRRCREILQHNGALLIFSEGVCVVEKRLRPLKKGTARIAFDAAFTAGLPVQIVPVGINYTHPFSLRAEVMVSVAPPIDVQQFRDTYTDHPGKAVRLLNEQLYRQLTDRMIIQHEATTALSEHVLGIWRNGQSMPRKWLNGQDERRKAEKKICAAVNIALMEQPSDYHELHRMIEDYFSYRQQYAVGDHLISGVPYVQWWIKCCWLAGYPLYAAGWLLNYWTVAAATRIVKRRVKDPVFYSSVRFSAAFLLYLVYFFSTLLLLVFLAPQCTWLAALLPLSGAYSIWHYELGVRIKQAANYKRLNSSSPDWFAACKARRGAVIKALQEYGIIEQTEVHNL